MKELLQAAIGTRDEIRVMICQLVKFDEKAANDIANIAYGKFNERVEHKLYDNFTYKKDPMTSEFFFTCSVF